MLTNAINMVAAHESGGSDNMAISTMNKVYLLNNEQTIAKDDNTWIKCHCGTAVRTAGSGGTVMPPPSAIQPIGRGYWIFGDWTPPMAVPPIQSSLVLGGVISRNWATLNPALGVYDFTQLGTDIDNCIANGKKFAIKIRAGKFSPAWLAGAGVPYHTFSEVAHDGSPFAVLQTFNLPIFYNATYKTHWINFINALGAWLQGNPTRFANMAFIAANGINRETAEIRIPYQVNSTFGINNPAVWATLGYTSQIGYDTYREFRIALDTAFGGAKPIVYPIVPKRFPDMGDGRDVLVEIVNDLAAADTSKYYTQDTFITHTFTGQSIDNLSKNKGLRVLGQLATTNYFNISTNNARLLQALQKYIDWGGYPYMEIYESNVTDYVTELTAKKPLYS